MTAPSLPLTRPARSTLSDFWGSYAPGLLRELFAGVRFTPSFLALLYYTFGILTYHAPGTRIAMIVALVMLTLEISTLRWNAAQTWIFAFVGWGYVSALMGAGAAPEAMIGAEDLLKLGVISFVIYNAVRTPEQLRFYVAFLIGSFLIYPVRGAFLNYLGGYSTFGRAIWNNAYGNPNDLAAFCLLFLSLCLAYVYIGRSKLWRLGALGASALITLLLFLTQSRGGILALAASVILGLMVLRQRGRAIGVVSILFLLSLPFVPDSAWERLRGLRNVSTQRGMKNVDREGSAQQRYQVLQVALQISREHPLFGVGPKMYPTTSVEYGRRLIGQYPLARNVRDPHNTYLRLTTELGLPGLVLFLCMVGTVLRLTWIRGAELLARGEPSAQVYRLICLGIVAYLLAGLFGSLPYVNMLYVLLALQGSLQAHAASALAAPVRRLDPMTRREAPPAPMQGRRGGLAHG
jgi:putative inorganic carbon (HCO3(-)) transporter